MPPEEPWQGFLPNGLPDPHSPGLETDHQILRQRGEIYASALVVLYRSLEGGELEVLFQERSLDIDNNLQRWDLSAGGHIDYQETALQAAVRELREELGVTAEPQDLIDAFKLSYDFCFCHVFFCDWTNRKDHFVADSYEVSDLRWVNYRDLETFWQEHIKPSLLHDSLFLPLIKRHLRIHADFFEHVKIDFEHPTAW